MFTAKNLIILVFCILLVCSMQASAACTAVYVGCEASDDGSVIFARSNDSQGVAANHLKCMLGKLRSSDLWRLCATFKRLC